jgi:hypothetical protein
MIFSIKEICSVEEPTFKWVNIYGAPIGRSGATCTKMNNNPELASTWRGRILIQYYAEPTKNPVMKIQPISKEVKQASVAYNH